ncbi:uncharacterized protein [Epargyreus clarus]|uniref:uncharacterized protein n=1 Tax=Epargyreus clarus TaxID=520877 RepID=UPI003C309662
MVTGPELSEWLRLSHASPRVRVRRTTERDAVRRCRNACSRATLSPCIKACLRLVADRAVTDIGLPTILAFLFESRDKLLKAHMSKPVHERQALTTLTNNCLFKCTPHWARQWAQFCDIAFKRICMRVCMVICERECRSSCRQPCTRTPYSQIYAKRAARYRISLCLLKCINYCVKACRRACILLAQNWLQHRAEHICKPILEETAHRLTNLWLAQDIIEERRKMTDKCNVANGCKF